MLQPLRTPRLLAGLLVGTVLALALHSTPSVRAATVTVTNTNDSGAGSLRQAIADAAAGDTITFAPGVTGTIVLTSGTLTLTKDVTIQGPGASMLAVDGGHTGTGAFCGGSVDPGVTVFRVQPGVTAAMRGLTVQHGCSPLLIMTTNELVGSPGGGIDNQGALTLTEMTVADNYAGADPHGGRGGNGGGIANDGTLALTNVTIAGNHVSRNGVGGGLMNTGTVTMDRSTVRGNVSESAGGGIDNDVLSGEIQESFGGPTPVPARITIRESTVADNRALEGGGLFDVSGGIAVIIRSTFSGNRTFGRAEGGGISIRSAQEFFFPLASQLIVVNSTISGNIAGDDPNNSCGAGGGIFSAGLRFTQLAELTIVGTTISNNFASGGGPNSQCIAGGGLFLGGVTLSLVGSIVAGNAVSVPNGGPDIHEISVNGIIGQYDLIGSSEGNSFIDGTNHNHVGAQSAPLNPLLGPLAGNGGPTQTQALLPGSLAIDAAGSPCVTDSTTGQPLTTDQRGIGRPQRAACDIGAYEVGPTAIGIAPVAAPAGRAGSAVNGTPATGGAATPAPIPTGR